MKVAILKPVIFRNQYSTVPNDVTSVEQKVRVEISLSRGVERRTRIRFFSCSLIAIVWLSLLSFARISAEEIMKLCGFSSATEFVFQFWKKKDIRFRFSIYHTATYILMIKPHKYF